MTEENIPDAKRIITEYSVLSYNKDKDLSLVEVILHTGRTHQIRAHFAFLGHALLGDGKYANNKSDRAMGWSKQALYSYCVRFDPQTPFFEYLRDKEIRVDLENVPFTKLFDN